jgi:hypothetical protein
MTPSRHLLTWLQFSNSNYDKPSNQILNSPMPLSRQTRSQTTIPTQDISNAPLPPRVVTPRTIHPSPPRVPTHLQRLSPRNLSQNDFCGMDKSHMAIALGDNHCVDIPPSSQPERALSALIYGLRPNCNISQSSYGRTPIACAHTTGDSNARLSQISYRNLPTAQYRQ